MKRIIIAGNWKMNPVTKKEANTLFNSVNRVKKAKNVEVVLCPPFVYLPLLKGSLSIGAQDSYWEEKGAFTGEVSSLMLKDLGCKYVIVGHSERRKYFAETDSVVNKKIEAALRAGLNVILCIGESQKERSWGKTQHILEVQIKEGLHGISKTKAKDIVIAYEPLWAIGTGKACPPDEAEKASLLIRKVIANIFSKGVAKRLQVLYGGSANSKNAESYLRELEIQGLLIGGASLKSKEFAKIIKAANKV